MSRTKLSAPPLVGITCLVQRLEEDYSNYDLMCDHRYARAIRDAGGHPVLLPIAHTKAVTSRYVEEIDGLVIVGGNDVDPRLYGEKPHPSTSVVYAKRSRFETWLYRMGVQRRLPIFGICYGMQLINVLEGGTLIQHLRIGRGGVESEHEGKLVPSHRVDMIPGTRLHGILGGRGAQVVTGHHQAVQRLAPGFVTSAVAPDGVIEAIESPAKPRVLAVQWHPEHLPRSRSTRKLFDAFVADCDEYRLARYGRRP